MNANIFSLTLHSFTSSVLVNTKQNKTRRKKKHKEENKTLLL